MPHYHNNILVVTYEELVPKFYKSMNSLKAIVYRANKRGYGIKRVTRGHNNGKSLIEVDSLPAYMQEHFSRLDNFHILEQYFLIDAAAVKFYQNYKFDDGSYLDEEKQDLYVGNASILQAIWKLKAARETEIINKGKRPKRIWEGLLYDVTTFETHLIDKYELQCNLPENHRRFQQIAEKFLEKGYESLISKKFKNINAIKVTDITLILLESLFAHQKHKPTPTDIYRDYNAFLSGYIEVINNNTGEVYNPKEFTTLSKATIRNYLANWESKIGTYALRSGDRQKLMEQFSIPHSLKQGEFAGSIISVDDVCLPIEYAKGQRPWFYLAYDINSECITTWVYGKSKEGIITEFYQQMVRNYTEWECALPAELEAESSLNSSFKTTFLREGNMFEHVRIEANKARAKRIERFNKEWRYKFMKKLNGFRARPHAKSEANQPGPNKAEIIPYEKIIEAALLAIQEYNNTPHSKYPEYSKFEYFKEKQHPRLKPTNYRGIIPYLGHTTKTSCNVGQVKLQSSEFLLGNDGKIATGEELIKLMTLIEGQQITVKWLDDNYYNVLKAYAFIGDRFICELIAKPVYHRAKVDQIPEDVIARELMCKYQMSIEGFANKRRKSIDKITVLETGFAPKKTSFKISELHPSEKKIESAAVAVMPDNLDFEDELNDFEPAYKQSLIDRF